MGENKKSQWECCKDEKISKNIKVNLKSREEAEDAVDSVIKYLQNSIMCQKEFDNKKIASTYDVVLANFLADGVGFSKSSIKSKVYLMVNEQSAQIGVKPPKVFIYDAPIDKGKEYVYARASVAGKIDLRIGGVEGLKNADVAKSNCLKHSLEVKNNYKSQQIARKFLRENAINEWSFVYGNLVHELEHINQYATIKEFIKDPIYNPFYEMMTAYLIMKVSNCKANNSALKSLYSNVGYIYDVFEVDARVNTMDRLAHIYAENDLDDGSKQKVLDALKLLVYEELSNVKNYGLSYTYMVNSQLNRTKDMFEAIYKNTEIGENVLERYSKINVEKKALKGIRNIDKNFLPFAKSVADEESETKFGKIVQIGLSYKLNEIEKEREN